MRQYIKEIGKDSTIYSLSNILTKAIGIFLIPIYTRFLTPEDYGIISLISPFVGVVFILFNLGLHGAWQRFYFDFPDRSTEQKIVFGNIFTFILIFSFAFCLILTLFGQPLFNIIFPNIDFYPYVVMSLWTGFFLIYFELKLSLFRVRKQALLFGVFSFVKFLLIVGLTIFAVVYLNKGAIGKIFSELVVAFLFSIIAISLLVKDIKFGISFKKLKPILRYAIPLLPHSLAAIIASFSGRFFINYYYGLTDTAIFNIGFLIGSIMQLIVASINNSWIPFFNNKANEGNSDNNIVFSKLTTYYTIAVFFIGLTLVFFGREAILILGTETYLPGAKIIPIIVISYVFNGFYYVAVSKILFVKKSVKVLPLITISSAVLNILLNWLLVPLYGIIGSAIASLIYMLVMFLVTFYISQKVFYIKYDFKRLGVLSLIFIVYIGIFYIFTFFNNFNMVLTIFIKIFIIISFIFVLFFSKFLTESELDNLKNIFSKLKLKYIK